MTIVDLDQFKSKRGKAATPERKERRKPFQAQWVRFPLSWLATLRRTKSGYAKQLALEILFAEFRQQHIGGDIVLSEAMTRLPHPARARAIKELVRLGLIEVERHDRHAVRVSRVRTEQPDDHQRPT